MSIFGLTEDRTKITTAFAVSIAVHLAVGAVWIGLAALPQPHFSFSETEEPLELTILPMETEIARQQRAFLQNTQPADQAPEEALFEAAFDAKAGSDAPATGEMPLPSQEGEETLGLTFREQELGLGEMAVPGLGDGLPLEQTMSREQQPVRNEEPVDQVTRAEPAKSQESPEIGDLALLAQPATKDEQRHEEIQQDEPVRRAEPVRLAVGTGPAGYQPQLRRSAITGGVTRPGPAGVDAVGTPLGRYKQIIADAVSSRWYRILDHRRDLVGVGTVRIRFVVREDGSISDTVVVSNTANKASELLSLEAILSTELPPIPMDVVGVLDKRQMDIDFSFGIR
ncbi:MAG: hypothetical protein SNJ52_02180 [Verrucomicrobiia bacterium]